MDKINYEDFGFRKGFNWENRFMLRDEKVYKNENAFVSTVDLGLDHSFNSDTPLYYETMVFLGEDENRRDVYQHRYETEEQAILGHQKVLLAIDNDFFCILDGYYGDEKVDEKQLRRIKNNLIIEIENKKAKLIENVIKENEEELRSMNIKEKEEFLLKKASEVSNKFDEFIDKMCGK